MIVFRGRRFARFQAYATEWPANPVPAIAGLPPLRAVVYFLDNPEKWIKPILV